MLVNQEKVLLPVVVTSMALCELFYLIVAIWKFSLDAPYCIVQVSIIVIVTC